ncbi:MAG: gliding motility-associated C-terminal domain-containing protein, partial [Flavobacteriales bacterium]|nr:gliding motility-associated C-terminal domain-containing protein [Flavobacteriales bacterium]
GPNGFTSTEANISGLDAGTYCLTILDANGCTIERCTDLDTPLMLEASAVATPSSCGSDDGTVDLTVNGGSAPLSFAWNNGANTEDLSDLQANSYDVTVTDANGCTVSTTAVVAGTPGLVANGVTDNSTCFGTSEGGVDLSVITGTAPFTFAWSNGSTAEDLVGVPAGSYSVSVTDDAGCAYQATYVVLENPEISIDTIVSAYSGGYNVSAYGAQDGSITTAVSGGTEPFMFEWSNGATSESISGLAAGEYSLVVTDANGCKATLEVTLTENSDIEMPTGFSPNNDGSNDTFVVRGIDGYPQNLFTVVNRWGNVVYEQPNYKNQWSGDNSQGAQLPDGTYFIILSLNDGTRTLQGYVDLRR